ncbi:probable disease resistance protein RF45 [Prunus avium]|uniref:Probable disease resistance protein RF45 n=2 Tax=Prunus avium TaxID=42229 RepID=A0A6P5RBM1_PRUAV|nr:probable disease resistance protein RF45 [Prunus avium]
MDPCRRVVSIVGMGGLGKTTLAKKLYNHCDLKYKFDCKAFVYVSNDYSRRDTLQGIIAATSPDCNMEDLKKLAEETLVLKLHELLKERRYLVVLDDIWETEVWDSMQFAFPSGKLGSKVMLTTRNKEVALYADVMSKPIEPRFLTQDESLELFCKKAFPEMDKMPSDLEKLGRDMMAKCGGLPLAVVVLGGLLSKKRKIAEEWRRVLENINWRLIDQDRVSAILGLSYNDLPFHLKSCFLYLGLFPEDSSISKTKLIHLWVAEGFLPQQGEEVAEGVAENCLNELVDRCMIQVGTLTSLGNLKTVRMHDVLREFSISKGREESFLEIYSGQEIESPKSQRTKCRRLAIHGEHDNLYVFLKPYAPYLRSLLFFNMGDSKLDFVFKDFKLLKVLDGVPFSSRALSAVGNLIPLKYLGVLLETYMDKIDLPRSIGKLKNLQTLEVTTFKNRQCFPDVIWKLKNLRHLVVKGRIAVMDSRLDFLNNLRTLKWVKGGRWIEDGCLASLTNLRRLKIVLDTQEELNSVVSNIERLHCLESLFLTSATLTTAIRLSHLEHLHKLYLTGSLMKLPDPHQFPPNLVKLSLSHSNLEEDSIVKLGRLPNLKMLFLGFDSYTGTKLVFSSSEGFPQLHILHLYLLDDLKELIVEEGAMMKLKNLNIDHCPRLRKIPERFKLLTTHLLKERKWDLY